MINKDIEFNSRKFMILLSLICIVFFLIVMKAFDYIPKNTTESYETEIPMAHNAVVQQEQTEEDDAQQEEEQNPVIEVKQQSAAQDSEIDEIDAPPGVNPINEQKLETQKISDSETTNNPVICLYNANNLKKEKKYNDALAEYQKVVENTEDKDLKASAYEGISTVYAINRRYGTALSFALKAYNISPNSNRALLAAQLYNKTGETQRASQILNRLLQEEFK